MKDQHPFAREKTRGGNAVPPAKNRPSLSNFKRTLRAELARCRTRPHPAAIWKVVRERLAAAREAFARALEQAPPRKKRGRFL